MHQTHHHSPEHATLTATIGDLVELSCPYPSGIVFCSISPNQTFNFFFFFYTKGKILMFSRAGFSDPSMSIVLKFLPVIVDLFLY